MNILHLVSGRLNGGAAKGAYWLHKGLIEEGVNSRILCNSRETYNEDTVFTINNSATDWIKNAALKRIDKLPAKLYLNRENTLFSTGICGFDITDHELYNSADLIHLHWINGLVKLKDLPKFQKPMVWTIRDMWPFTGGCHYSMGCEKYKFNCGECPQLGSSTKNDLSKYVFNKKKLHIPKNITAVGISPWISQELNKSTLFKDKVVKTIFNNIDCNDFYPFEKQMARQKLNIDTSKKIILVGAQNPNSFYKGFQKFIESMKCLNKEEYLVLFFGRLDESLLGRLEFEYKSFGFISDIKILRLIYSAADVFIAPSLMEAFGKTIAEAMACGTPVVCFDATGPKDMVSHKKDGYKAKPFESNDLAEGISWTLEDKNRRTRLSEQARKSAVEKFHLEKIAKNYIQLYDSILK